MQPREAREDRVPSKGLEDHPRLHVVYDDLQYLDLPFANYRFILFLFFCSSHFALSAYLDVVMVLKVGGLKSVVELKSIADR